MIKYLYLLTATTLFFSVFMYAEHLDLEKNEEAMQSKNIVFCPIPPKKVQKTDQYFNPLTFSGTASGGMSNSFEFFTNLPNEITYHIFRFLPLNTLGYIEQVSLFFRSFLQFPNIWNFNLQKIGIKNANDPKENCIKYREDIALYYKALGDKSIIEKLSRRYALLLERKNYCEKLNRFVSDYLSSGISHKNAEKNYLEIIAHSSLFDEQLKKIERRLTIVLGQEPSQWHVSRTVYYKEK